MEYQVGTTVFNDWVIIREIGKGATGTVFEIKKKEYNSMIPYGPFISVGALISILYGTNIMNWYIGLF